METFIIGFLVGIGTLATIAVTRWFSRRGRDKKSKSPSTAIQVEKFVTSMKSVGELTAFRIMTKEIISADDHWFGEFGKKYLRWLISAQKMTLIVEFDIDFRYDLNDISFEVTNDNEGAVKMVLPPCHHEILIRDMRIHSEGQTELLPWLMPDMLNRFLAGGFSVEAKNKLINETRDGAKRFARELVERVQREAETSARQTLTHMAHGLGATRIQIDFKQTDTFLPEIDTSRIEGEVEIETAKPETP